MRGLMMDVPLLIASQIRHAERIYEDQEVLSRNTDGSLHETTWGEVARRSRAIAHALAARGVQPGDRVATLAWNNHRHLELYFAVSGSGAVCHTLNPRLDPEELAYIINHAEDRVLFVDTTFLPLVAAIRSSLETLEEVVVMEGPDTMPDSAPADILCYEELLARGDSGYRWPDMDEGAAAALCYTSGTTGRPKGVLYSHRSTVLHSYAVALPNILGLGMDTPFLPVVPMFHVNAWGTPYACAMNGTPLVLPGPSLDGASLTEIMNEGRVTITAGVPTVWMGLLKHWRESGERVPTLEYVKVGGAAPPPALIRAFEEEFGIQVGHGWGMTETSPVGTVMGLSAGERERTTPDERVDLLSHQGRPLPGVELRIVDQNGKPLPEDGDTSGELQIRGPWVCSDYFRMDGGADRHTEDGWFRTGDVATLGPGGVMQITDRIKDLIKSGGEWISSIELENVASDHPDVEMAAAVAREDEEWGERPVLFVVPRSGSDPSPEEILEFFQGKVVKWWIPDEVRFVDEMPLGGTGKVQKRKLREML